MEPHGILKTANIIHAGKLLINIFRASFIESFHYEFVRSYSSARKLLAILIANFIKLLILKFGLLQVELHDIIFPGAITEAEWSFFGMFFNFHTNFTLLYDYYMNHY